MDLPVADEDAARSPDHPMNQARFLQRRQHLAQTGAACAVALGEVAFAAELRTGVARVDVGNDPAPQLLAWRSHRAPPYINLVRPILADLLFGERLLGFGENLAAVHDKRLARDVRRLIGGEEQGRIADVGDGAEPPCGY